MEPLTDLLEDHGPSQDDMAKQQQFREAWEWVLGDLKGRMVITHLLHKAMFGESLFVGNSNIYRHVALHDFATEVMQEIAFIDIDAYAGFHREMAGRWVLEAHENAKESTHE